MVGSLGMRWHIYSFPYLGLLMSRYMYQVSLPKILALNSLLNRTNYLAQPRVFTYASCVFYWKALDLSHDSYPVSVVQLYQYNYSVDAWKYICLSTLR